MGSTTKACRTLPRAQPGRPSTPNALVDFGAVKDRASTSEPSLSEPLETAHELFGQHQYKEALSQVLKLLQQQPNEPDLLLFAAACFFHLKDYKVLPAPPAAPAHCP